jgi:hypothetical protein
MERDPYYAALSPNMGQIYSFPRNTLFNISLLSSILLNKEEAVNLLALIGFMTSYCDAHDHY